MDKATPDQATCFRPIASAPPRCSPELKAEGIGHMIDGKIVPSISGLTFETTSPIDNSRARERRARQCGRYRPRRDGGAARLQVLARHAGRDAQEAAAPGRRCDRGQRRRYRGARMHRHRPGPSLHGQGRDPGRREFSLLRRQMRRGPRRPEHAERGALEHLDPGADRPRRRDHAVEHAVHALDLEDRPCARRRLHGRPQAGRMVAGDGRPAGQARASRRACPTACSTPCTASARKPARR